MTIWKICLHLAISWYLMKALLLWYLHLGCDQLPDEVQRKPPRPHMLLRIWLLQQAPGLHHCDHHHPCTNLCRLNMVTMKNQTALSWEKFSKSKLFIGYLTFNIKTFGLWFLKTFKSLLDGQVQASNMQMLKYTNMQIGIFTVWVYSCVC